MDPVCDEGSEQSAPRSSRASWILIASAKGGSGKTTVAQNLAVLAAGEGLRVLALDLDAQATLTKWAARRPAAAPPVETMTIRLRDVCVDGGARFAEADRRAASAQVVLLDTPPSLDDWPTETLRLLRKSDLVLVPTSQGVNDLDSVTEWMATLRRERARAAFVLNQVDRTQTSFAKAKTRLNRAGMLCPMEVRRLADIRNAAEHGLGAVEIGGSNASQEFVPVWDYVKNVLGLTP